MKYKFNDDTILRWTMTAGAIWILVVLFWLCSMFAPLIANADTCEDPVCESSLEYMFPDTSTVNWTQNAGTNQMSADVDLSGLPFSDYLALTGGTMSGDIDMDGNDIIGAGAVGIGTDTPSEQLEVIGNIELSGTTPAVQFTSADNRIEQTDTGTLGLYTGGTEAINVTSTAVTHKLETVFEEDISLEDSETAYIRAGYDVDMVPFVETALPAGGTTTASIGNITASDGTAVVAQFGVTTLGAPLSTNAAGIIFQETATTTPVFAMFDQSGNELCGYTGWSEDFFVSQNGTGTRAITVNGTTLETTLASAYTFPVTDGTSNQVLKTDGSGNVDWATVSVPDTLDDLSDVGTVAYDAYKVLIADGDDFNTGYLDRLYDSAGTNYVAADYKEDWPWGGTRDGMEIKSSTQDLILRAESADYLIFTDSPLMIGGYPGENPPQLYVRANAKNHIVYGDRSRPVWFESNRYNNEGTAATTLTATSFFTSDTWSGSSHITTVNLLASLQVQPAVSSNMNYATSQSNTIIASAGTYGTVARLRSAFNEATIKATNSQTYPAVSGVVGEAKLYASNATITRAVSFYSGDGAGTLASSTGTITAYEHFGISQTLTKSAGSTLTTQYGLRIPDLNTATTNYGVYIAAFTNTGGSDYGIYNLSEHYAGDDVTFADAKNIIINTSSGTKIGTSTAQKIGFWNVSPVVQPSSTGVTTGFTAGSGTGVNDDSTFTGNTGSTAYTIGDIVAHLKTIGLIAN